jgi:ABC-type amino acid transport substrate-binding protein
VTTVLRLLSAGAVLAGALAIAVLPACGARADALDDVISSGKLRCGAMLDFPPAGYRDQGNQPAGYDVEYCQDMAKALGVTPVIVETPSPQRLPALVSGQVDISIGSVTATTERAKTVAFTHPYLVYKLSVLVKQDSGIKKWEDLKGKQVAVARGTTPEIEYLKHCKTWAEGCHYDSYGSNGDQLLAFRQGKADAMIEASSFLGALINSDQGKGLTICCDVPGYTDWIAIAVPRGEQGLLNWINLFIFRQVDTGRYAELYTKWFGGAPPSLKRADVEF